MSTKANIVVEAGADFSVPISLTDNNNEALIVTLDDVDLFTAEAKMKKYYRASTSYDFDCALSNGELLISMSRTVSANIAPGRFVYDVKLTSLEGNTVSRPVEGLVTVTPRVT